MVTFAHQSGASWDEFLLVLVPLFVFGGLLLLAKRRADREAHEVPTEGEDGP